MASEAVACRGVRSSAAEIEQGGCVEGIITC